MHRRLVAVTALTALIGVPAVAAERAPVPRDGAGSSGEAARADGARHGAPRLADGLDGIDVSHWQGDIDWGAVGETDIRFVFLKATDDVDYVDPTFGANRAQARANGLAVGAYHFARPDPSAGDARREARHFVEVVSPGPGELLPVLDRETSRGLGQSGVTRWARTWVRVVRGLTGVTPLVYTSPYGWASRTGDTRLLARDGAPLWVAHWGVRSPTLPAGDWDGHGWVVWQHSSTGHVRGVGGNVDLDTLSGSRLGVITIRRLSLDVTGAGSVTSDPAGLGCRDTCTRSVDPDATVTFTAVPEDHAVFAGWSGACEGSGATCAVTMRGNRAVAARFVSDLTPPTASVTPPAGLTGPALVAFDEPVRGVGPSSLVLREAGGATVPARRACRSGAGAAVPCDAPSVRSVALRPASPLVPGRAYEVRVNPGGVAPAIRDRAGNAATPGDVGFEAVRSVEQTSAAIVRRPSGAWSAARNTRASGGSFTVTRRAGASARLAFDGTGVDVRTVTGPDRGRAQLLVDGELQRTVDLFSRTRAFGVMLRLDGLADGPHVLRIVATGHARPGSAGIAVAVDRLDVLD